MPLVLYHPPSSQYEPGHFDEYTDVLFITALKNTYKKPMPARSFQA
jgi:hypothetical protein